MTEWLEHLTCSWIAGLSTDSTISGTSCIFLEQETSSTLFSTGWFQELTQVRIKSAKKTFAAVVPKYIRKLVNQFIRTCQETHLQQDIQQTKTTLHMTTNMGYMLLKYCHVG